MTDNDKYNEKVEIIENWINDNFIITDNNEDSIVIYEIYNKFINEIKMDIHYDNFENLFIDTFPLTEYCKNVNLCYSKFMFILGIKYKDPSIIPNDLLFTMNDEHIIYKPSGNKIQDELDILHKQLHHINDEINKRKDMLNK
jgi:hypothetical protein